MAFVISKPTSFRAATELAVKAFVLEARRTVNDLAKGSEPDAPSFGTEYVVPRFTPATWLSLTEHSTRLRRCCEAIARNAVGLGVVAIPHEAADKAEGRRNLSKQIAEDVQALALLLKQPNTMLEPFPEVLFKAEFDYQACGNGALEIVEDERAAGGTPIGILHLPFANVRVHVSRDKFVRMYSNGVRRHYRRFGDTNPEHKFIDHTSGQFYAVWPAELPLDRRGSAVIHVKNYSPLDEFYGIPPSAPAVHAIVGNKLSSQWNVNFLQNNAHIPLAVIVEDGNLSPASIEQIELFLSRDAAGLKNAGRLMVLQPDLSTAVPNQTTKIRLEPLKIGVNDDASFLKYRETNSAEIMEAYGISGIILGLGGSATRATALAEKQVALEQVILPRTQFWEFVLNGGLFRSVGRGGAQAKFRRTTNLDALQRTSVIQKLMPGLTIDDVRRHAAELMQDPSLAALADATSSTPFGLLKQHRFDPSVFEDVMDRLEAAVPPAGLVAEAA